MHKVTQLPITFLAATALTLAGASVLYLRAHSQPPGQPASVAAGEFKAEVKMEVQDGFRIITSNGIPDHPTGAFPNRGNPNSISPQSYHYRVTMTPKLTGSDTRTRLFGVAINGVPFDPGTAELWNNDQRWHYEALSGLLFSRGGLGVDSNLAHVQPNGAYHYHGLPTGLLNKRDYIHRMALIGYAADGFPIYGPYAYTNPNDPKSPLKQLKSSYRLKDGMRPGGADSPGGAYDGSFESDYEYVKGLGDLDTTNGRTGVTPEYPQGTYYYVITGGWPFIPRSVKGTPDASFNRRGPGGGPGGPGGPGGIAQGPGGGGPGFGGPGQGPGGQGSPGGFPGGPDSGQRRFGGQPNGLVPASALESYLGLTAPQKAKLDALVKTMDALNRENFAIPAFAELKLDDDQIRKIAAGAKVADVLSASQKKVLAARKRPGFPGPGGPGGPGRFGGPGQGGPGRLGGPGQGGPDGPPPGE
ncbi:MAG: hypothetical protein JWL77_3057 [Chthonomonadaceae bacterium]|nr:hypothetical protein [Chthonomonadaceae bacterium]